MAGPDREAVELRAVAPLVVVGATPQLVGPVTIVANGDRLLAITSAELVRPHQGKPLAIVTKLDGSARVQVASWGMGRYSGVGLIELAGPVPANHDVQPLSIAAVCATSDTRGAPSAFAVIVASARGFERRLIPVYVDRDDGGGMSDTVMRLASPIDAAQATISVEGAPLFSWFPPDPALGRPSEVLAVAMGYPYRARTAQPRATPVIAELIGLDDLGRALISAHEPDERPELAQVAGEITDPTDRADPADPLKGL